MYVSFLFVFYPAQAKKFQTLLCQSKPYVNIFKTGLAQILRLY